MTSVEAGLELQIERISSGCSFPVEAELTGHIQKNVINTQCLQNEINKLRLEYVEFLQSVCE